MIHTNAGLFGRVDVDGTICNLILDDSTIKSTSGNVGGVAGILGGNIQNVYVGENTVIQTSGRPIGGVVGIWDSKDNATKKTASGLWFAGTVETSNEKAMIGGLIGRVYVGNHVIENCLNTGTVISTYTSTTNGIGGLIGSVNGSSATKQVGVSIQNCVMNGKIQTATTSYTGSVIGSLQNAKVTMQNVYSTDDRSGLEGVAQEFTDSGSAPGIGVVNSGSAVTVSLTGVPMILTEDSLKGNNAYVNTALDIYTGNNEEAVWSAIEGETPEIRMFSEKPAYAELSGPRVSIAWYYEAYTNMDGTTATSAVALPSAAEFEIRTAGDMYGLAKLVNVDKKTFSGCKITLTNDITMNEGTASVNGWTTAKDTISYEWTPIGQNGSTIYFNGTFDGACHTIRGIYINDTDADLPAGLFGRTAGGANIRNLFIENSYIKNKYTYVAAVVGYFRGNMENVAVSKDVFIKTTSTEAGGVIGRMDQGSGGRTIINVMFAGSVQATGSVSRCGGIIAKINSSNALTMRNCLNSGTVTTTNSSSNVRTGGLIGSVESTSVVTMEECLNTGTLSAKNVSFLGNVIGQAKGKTLTITNVYALESLNGIGKNETNGTTTGNVLLCTAPQLTGETAKTTLQEFDFYNATSNPLGVWESVKDAYPTLRINVEEDTSASDWYTNAGGAEGTNYEIGTAGELFYLASLVNDGTDNFEGKTIALKSDITVSAAPNEIMWTPIGLGTSVPFKGTFDGGGHTISGIYINTNTNAGLFGRVSSSGKIRNLSLDNSTITSSANNVGAVVGILAGSMEKVYVGVNTTVTASQSAVGGIVGIWDSSGNTKTVSELWFAGHVENGKNSARTGAIFGRVYQGKALTMENCLCTGSVKTITAGDDLRTGGLVGTVYGGTVNLTMKNCLMVGTVEAASNNKGGSLVGAVQSGTLTLINVYAVESEMQGIGLVDAEKNGSCSGTVKLCTENALEGAIAQTTLAGFEFWSTSNTNGVWFAIEGSFPELKYFSKKTPISQ